MTININASGLRTVMDQAPPNQLPDALRVLGFGAILRAMKTFLRTKNPNAAPANPYVHSTLQALTLPDDAKANTILRAYARAGTGTKGELTVSAYGTTPTGAHVAVAPNGDIVFLATDAYTNVDVVYEPEKYDVVEMVLPVVTGTLTIPTKYAGQGVVLLMEAESLAGTNTGKFEVLVPAASTAVTKTACLNVAKTAVMFDNTDNAVTSARVKLAISSAIDVDALLTAVSPVL